MNRIFSEQFANQLNKSLARLYCVVGQDPLLQTETHDLLVSIAFSQGFDEKFEVVIDNSTDWESIFERTQSMGLFFEKQIIFLTCPENLSVSLQKNLQSLIALLHTDVILVLQFSKLTKLMEKQAWFIDAGKYEPQAIIVNCQTPSREQLPKWISNRAASMNINIDEDAIELLCYSYENNLLALKQNLQLLSLLYTDKKLTYNRVKEVIEQSSVFTVFHWIDALFEGRAERAKRILEGLQSDDVQPIILLRTLQRELVTILNLTKPEGKITNVDDFLHRYRLRENFDQFKIWQNRRPFFIQIIQRLTYRRLYSLIQALANIERIAKLEFTDIIWEKLLDISIEITR